MSRHASRLAKLEARHRQAIRPDIDAAIRRELARLTTTPAEIAALEAEAAGEGIDADIARELARLARQAPTKPPARTRQEGPGRAKAAHYGRKDG